MGRAFRGAWLTLRRPGLLLPALLAVAAVTVLSTVVTITSAGGQDVRRGPGEAVTLADLAASDGMLRGLRSAATLLGVVCLCVAAAHVGSTYSLGTLRTFLVRQPHRLRLLAGTWLAIAAVALIAAAVTTVVGIGVAFPVA
ncbi:MAG TPA: ABC transporter permease, partial [Frankiaceae bacterium]|nr:ABC transporter permease [Frankiaceae bacterium]